MASTSHRRCQYQGDGCMGTAHAGHDQCAHCFFTYIKPQIAAERLAVKGRRAAKRNQLSAATRSLISEVDLREPQMKNGGVELPPPLRNSKAIRDAIYDIELDRLIENKTEEEALEAVTAELVKLDLKNLDVPVIIDAVQPKYKSFPDLSAEERQDICDAYAANITVGDISKTWNISTYTLYQVTKAAGLDLRSAPGRKSAVWVPAEPAPFTLQEEPLLPQSTPPVSPVKVETPPPNGVVSPLPEWTVTYTVTRTTTETVVVAAKDFNAAAHAAAGEAAVGDDGTVEVVSVSRKAR